MYNILENMYPPRETISKCHSADKYEMEKEKRGKCEGKGEKDERGN
jgi:hypothetical protein